MNGQDEKRILLSLNLNSVSKSITNMRIKLDKVNASLSPDIKRSDAENNRLLSSKQTLETRIEKYIKKHDKIKQHLDIDNPAKTDFQGLSQVINATNNSVQNVSPAHPEFITKPDGKFRVLGNYYKTVRVGKDGKDTKQVKYFSESEVE